MRVVSVFVLAFALLAAADEVQDCTVNPCATTTPSLSGKLMLPVIVTKTVPATLDQIQAMRADDDRTRQFDDRSTIVYSTTQVRPTVIDRSRPVTPVYVDHVEKPAAEPSPCDCFNTCSQNVTEVEPEPQPCACACNQLPKNETATEEEEPKPEEPEPAPSTDVSEDDVNRMKEGRDMAENVLKEIEERQHEIDEGINAIQEGFGEKDQDVQEVYDRVKALAAQRDAKRARIELLEKRIEVLEEKLRDAVEVTNSDKYKAAEQAKVEESEDKDAVIKRLESRIDALEQKLQSQHSNKNYRFMSRPDYIDPSDTMLRVNSMVPASLKRAKEQGPYDYHIPKTLLLE